MKNKNTKHRKPTETECGKATAANHAFNQGCNQTRREWLAIAEKLNAEIGELRLLNAKAKGK